MTTIESNFAERLADLNGTLAEYARHTRRSPDDIIRRKTAQVILGIGVRDNHVPGLFERLAATAPQKGRITRERRADSWRVGLPDSRSLRLGQARAAALLGAEKSGAFRINFGDAGNEVQYLAGVQRGKILKRGRRKGTIAFGSRAKTAAVAFGVTRAAARAAGGVLLNRQALIAALTISRREKSRFATAAQFLPRRYRTVLNRRPELAYQRGQAVGLNSVDAAQAHHHERVLIENKKGRPLGSLELLVSGAGASARIRGDLGLHNSAQHAALDQALQLVTADTAAYVLAKQNATFARAAAANGLRAA